MTEEVPRIAATLVRTEFAGPIALVFALFFSWPRHYAFSAASLVFCVVVCLFTIRDLSTRLTPRSVSQWTWRGRIVLDWEAVERIDRTARSVTLSGGAGRIVIPLERFSDAGATMQFIAAHLPERLRQ
jgi:hypothetical protein